MEYNYIIAGAGFYGAVIAERIANDLKKPVLVLEKRNHIGGNCYSEINEETGIEYHKYGTHIFHTSDEKVWKYINRFTEFNSYYHQVLTTYNDRVYQMPINLETINSFYNKNLKPSEVQAFLAKEIEKENLEEKDPENFEEKAISMIGRPLYEAFIRGYTKKQWGVDPKELPAAILKRLPFRTNYNESYYFSKWQGIPLEGYTAIFKKLLASPLIKVELNSDYLKLRDTLPKDAIVIYSGPIDAYFDYRYGRLSWRSLEFEESVVNVPDYQGTSVMNYGNEEVPFTRIHEPSHLHPEREPHASKSLIIKEFSISDDGTNPYYPLSNPRNKELFERYRQDAEKEPNLIVGGRLGDYKYYDMHHTIGQALETYEKKIKQGNEF